MFLIDCPGSGKNEPLTSPDILLSKRFYYINGPWNTCIQADHFSREALPKSNLVSNNDVSCMRTRVIKQKVKNLARVSTLLTSADGVKMAMFN